MNKEPKDINKFKIEDETIILSTKRKQQIKATCLICPDSFLDIKNYNEDTKSDLVMQCPKCHRQYFPSSEIMEYEDVLTGPHDDNINIELEGVSALHKPVVLFSDEDEFNNEDDQKKKGGFYSMDYLKGLGKTIVQVRQQETEPDQ